MVHEIAKRGVESGIASPPKDHNSCIGMGASALGVQLRFPYTLRRWISRFRPGERPACAGKVRRPGFVIVKLTNEETEAWEKAGPLGPSDRPRGDSAPCPAFTPPELGAKQRFDRASSNAHIAPLLLMSTQN